LEAQIRTRFEQIFYGLTVSKETPYIGYFTSKDQVSRHKFFVEDPNNKTQYVDMNMWSTWWSSTKPSRNIPTLVLFRGTTKHDFDRIAITEKDIVVSTYRSEKNTEELETLRKDSETWLLSLDAVIPFVEKRDLDKSRWELQDLSLYLKYSKKLDEFDLRRMNCLSTIFDIADKSKAQFNLLRSDHSNDGISAIEVKLLQAMRDNFSINPQEVAEELSIPVSEARTPDSKT
jgi:hypothetical protein